MASLTSPFLRRIAHVNERRGHSVDALTRAKAPTMGLLAHDHVVE